MASCVASTLRAVSTWRFSTILPLVGHHTGAARDGLLEGGDHPAGVLDVGLARREDLVADVDLAGVDQRLAVEAHLPTLDALGPEALGVLDVVEDPVDDRDLAARAASMAQDSAGRTGPRRERAAPRLL